MSESPNWTIKVVDQHREIWAGPRLVATLYHTTDQGVDDYAKLIADAPGMAKRIAELEHALDEVHNFLGPAAPRCDGCSIEISWALDAIRKAVRDGS